jgi:hypothetical protein
MIAPTAVKSAKAAATISRKVEETSPGTVLPT